MADRENQRVILTKRLLKDSLIQMLKQENIYKISIRELCENAGINRSTFYKYYGSQYDLLSEMENELLSYVQKSICDVGYLSKMEDIHLLSVILQYLEDNIELTRLLINNNVDPEFPRKLIRLTQSQESVKQRLTKYCSPQHQEYLFTFIVYGGYNMIGSWINRDDREPAQEIAELFMSTIYRLWSEDSSVAE